MCPIENFNINFKGFVDAVVKVGDIISSYLIGRLAPGDGILARKAEKLVTYQLTLYTNISSVRSIKSTQISVETHFALLKRTAKKEPCRDI